MLSDPENILLVLLAVEKVALRPSHMILKLRKTQRKKNVVLFVPYRGMAKQGPR